MKNKTRREKIEVESEDEKPNLKGDYGNILILFLLYVLQGGKNFVLLHKALN